jgi:ABC-type lipoprotein release transport system permease subunit
MISGYTHGVGGKGLALTRLMSSLLGIKPTDPATFAVVSIGLLSAAAVSSYLPAHRAAVNPVEALRAE